MLKTLGFTTALCVVALTPAILAAQNFGGPAPVVTDPSQRTGPQVFNETCVSCHGRDLKGGTGAKSLFTVNIGRAKSDAELRTAIENGPAGVPGHDFKGKVTDYQIYSLVSYIRLQTANLNPKAFVGAPHGETFKSQKATFKIDTFADGLETPWGMDFLPDGRLLVSERPGRLRIISKDGKVSAPVTGTPKVFERQDAGMLDIAVHPNYAKNGWIYMSYVDIQPGYVAPPAPPAPATPAPAPGGFNRTPSPPNMTVWIRGKLNSRNEWVDQQEIYRVPNEVYSTQVVHYGSRFLFDGKGHVFFTIGERGVMANAQDLKTPLGKVHRINEDGSIPADNPFVNTPGAVKSIWTYGHRNPEGLAIDPRTGILWETEHGPTGGDELNIIEKGKNYGWGVISQGIQPGITSTTREGMETPIAYWMPTMAPSGIQFYTGNKFPGWKNSLMVSGLLGQQLRRIEIQGRRVVTQEPLYEIYGRTRAVKQGPDGNIYVLLQNPTGPGTSVGLAASTPGRVARITPAR